MSTPLVSVVIPVFNQRTFAEETVASVCEQKYGNLEIIVVDDGSTDATADLLESKFGSKIKLIRRTNGGPSAASNTGILAASGSYIVLLGGDDLSTPDRVAHQIDILESTDNDIIFCKPDLIDGDGEPLPINDFPIFHREVKERTLFRELTLHGNFFCAPSAAMRRNVVDRIGLFHPGLIQLQDYEYWLRAVGAGLKLQRFDQVCVSYRRHVSNLSSSNRDLATDAEYPLVLGHALDHARPAVLRESFGELLEPQIHSDAALSYFDKCIILLAHPHTSVRKLGIARVIDLLNDAEQTATLEKRGVNIFKLLYNAGYGPK